MDLLFCLDFKHVNDATHFHRNTLDLVFTRGIDGDLAVESVPVTLLISKCNIMALTHIPINVLLSDVNLTS